MFGAKKKNSSDNQPEAEANEAVHKNLIVHNMPQTAKPTGPKSRRKTEVYSPAVIKTTGASAGAKANFKTVGLVIMVGGLIVISLLVYLSYIFIIKPVAKNQTGATAANQSATQTPATTSPLTAATPLGTTTTDIATASPDTLTAAELATLIASSTEATSTVTSTTALPLVDSDNDGVNDEEEAVFGTSPNRADTDNDGYSDLSEISNGYDPAGTGKLAANQKIGQYSSPTFNYQLLYPKDWAMNSLDNGATIDFSAPDNSLIQISVSDNTDKQSIMSWYSASFPNDTVTYDKLQSGSGWEGIMAVDGFNFYLTDAKKQNIYVISYIPAVDNRVAYPNVFKMVINSLVLK